MKDFSFNPEIARLYGVDEAIFIHHLNYWIEHNEANGRNYYEDAEFPGVWRHWTFNSAEAMAVLFPFWTKNKIDKLTRKMRDNGLTHIGNYNKNKFDRTKWYALSDEIISFYRQDGNSQTAECQTAKQQNEKQPNGRMSNSQTAEPIPDNIPNTIPDSKPDISSSAQPPGERFAEDSDEMKLCLLLAERMRQNKPDCKLPGNFQDWCRHVDLMIRIDGRTPKQIQDVIVFCQKDAFWQSNILSTKKLREKFDQLSMKMRSPAAKKPQQGGNPFLRKLERDGAI